MLVLEARHAGVERIVVTDGMLPPVGTGIEQMREAGRPGAQRIAANLRTLDRE